MKITTIVFLLTFLHNKCINKILKLNNDTNLRVRLEKYIINLFEKKIAQRKSRFMWQKFHVRVNKYALHNKSATFNLFERVYDRIEYSMDNLLTHIFHDLWFEIKTDNVLEFIFVIVRICLILKKNWFTKMIFLHHFQSVGIRNMRNEKFNTIISISIFSRNFNHFIQTFLNHKPQTLIPDSETFPTEHHFFVHTQGITAQTS